jgi:nitrate/nitrite-specific signal transduction histidine kinase
MKNRKIRNLIYVIFALSAFFIVFTRTRELLILNKLNNLNTNKNHLFETGLLLNENEILINSINTLRLVIQHSENNTDFKIFTDHYQNYSYQISINIQRINNLKQIQIPLKQNEFKKYSEEIANLYLNDYLKKYSVFLEKKETMLKLDETYPENSQNKIIIEESLNESINQLDVSLSEIYKKINIEFQKVNEIIKENNTFSDQYMENKYGNAKTIGIILLVLLISIFILIAGYLSQKIIVPVNKIQNHLDRITKGELPGDIEIKENLELKNIALSLNKVVLGLRKAAEFSEQIGKGNFDMKYKLLSNNDVLGNSLLTLRDNLQIALAEEEKRKKEDEQRNRTNIGLTLFAEILRQYPENLNLLADKIISTLVKFLNANQGALFFLNENDASNIYYELIGAYAYDRKKYLTKHIKPGEGLIGAVAIEKYTVYMTEVPDNYIEIESGTGSANPRSILIIPLKIELNVLGVIELASFNKFEKYEIEMAEKIAESIASSLANTAINMQTKALLEKSKDMERTVLEQEKELIQNSKEIRDLKKKIEELSSGPEK